MTSLEPYSHKASNIWMKSFLRLPRKRLLLTLLLLVFCLLGIGYYLISRQAEVFPYTFNTQQLQEDLAFLRQTLEEGHPGLYRYTSQPDLGRLFSETGKQLNRPMSADEFYRVLAPLVAGIKDGHTSLHPATILSRLIAGEQDIPFSVRIVDGQIYIWDDFATANNSLHGAQILSINDVLSATILQTLLLATPGDGNIQAGKINQIGRGGGAGFFRALFAPMLRPLLGISSPFTIRYRLPASAQPQTITITGQDFQALVTKYETRYPDDARPPLLPNGQIKPENQPYFVDNGNIAVWKFGGFGGYTPEDRNGAFIDKAFQQIRQQGSRFLILDVRNNTGGSDALGARLFSFFADQPFRYYNDLVANNLTFSFLAGADPSTPLPANEFEKQADGKYHWVKHPNWGTLQPLEPHFAGQVYVVINGGCFSTCGEFVSAMHFHKKALFVGEEVGAGYFGNTSGFQYDVFLPHTKLYITVPVVRYDLAVSGYPEADQGVKPDYPVQSPIDDLLAGKDNELSLALSLARGSH